MRYTLAPSERCTSSSQTYAIPRGPMTEILTESFCERCGTRYTFESARPRVRMTSVKVLSRGLKNFVLSDDTSIDEAMAAARSEADREATTHQLDAFHKTFNFCMSCRQYTCPNCWNESEARCLSCAPLALPELPVSIEEIRGFGEALLTMEPVPGNGSPGHQDDAMPAVAESATKPSEPVATETVDVAGKAAGQTMGLLKRFRPGQNLDEELAAYERERSDTEAIAAGPNAESEPAAGGTEQPAMAEPELELVAAEPEPELVAAAPEPELVAAEAEPVATDGEPEPPAAATAADVVEQPTWRITAPDPTPASPLDQPADRIGGVPLQANPSDGQSQAEPQWPARPQWPGSMPAAGLPYLGRPAAPQGGVDALWAASNQELVTAPVPPTPGRTASGIQPCVSCGLSLSATARFCRRCGTLQGH